MKWQGWVTHSQVFTEITLGFGYLNLSYLLKANINVEGTGWRSECHLTLE